MLKKSLSLFLISLLGFGIYIAYNQREELSLWWELTSPSPIWAQTQLDRDFSWFTSKGISQEALDSTFHKIQSHHIPIYRYRVINGEIYRTPSDEGPPQRIRTFDKMLKRLAKTGKLPNLDFLLCAMNGVPVANVPPDFWITSKQAPLLTWAMKKDATHLVLIPDFFTTRESGWHRDIATINKNYRSISWKSKIEQAFWRGTSSDKSYSLENYFEKPRFQISLLSIQHPHLIDAGFYRVYPEEVSQLFRKMNLYANHTPIAGHLRYKYLPSLDGYMCTFPGFQWKLFSGSLTLKQESDEIQYFYGALKPYVHYLPIKNDMSDLMEKISWAKAHDQEAREIAENARSFALKNLQPNHTYHYLYAVLQRYASYQQFDHLEIDSSWKQIDSSD